MLNRALWSECIHPMQSLSHVTLFWAFLCFESFPLKKICGVKRLCIQRYENHKEVRFLCAKTDIFSCDNTVVCVGISPCLMKHSAAPIIRRATERDPASALVEFITAHVYLWCSLIPGRHLLMNRFSPMNGARDISCFKIDVASQPLRKGTNISHRKLVSSSSIG